jgi:uncharacterized membrane-anchored protein
MTAWLRAALAVQFLFFALWGGRLLTSHRDVATVWLATEPVDPRDLLSGHYVALRYPIGDPQHAGCHARGAFDTVYLHLAPTDQRVTVADEVVELWDSVECRLDRPVTDDEVWITGRFDAQGILYGIERFYVPEASPLRAARSGTVVAAIAVNEAGEARLLDLLPKQQAPRE